MEAVVSQLEFAPNQIVCLESSPHYLFGEMIQHVRDRQRCWVRPLVLATGDPTDRHPINFGGEWYDLRDCSDLLLPEHLFRAALDTEVLPLMGQLYAAETKLTQREDPAIARQALHDLIRQVCQAPKPSATANPEAS
jgi:hypothetical protein